MKPAAEQRIAAGIGITGLFLVPKSKATAAVADSLLLIWAATQAKEWRDRIIFLPL